MKPLVEIIVPTYDNLNLLLQMLTSFNMSIQTPLAERVHYTVINNGTAPLRQYITSGPYIAVIEPGKNLGWEGGLKEGLKNTDAPFVMFANDDIRAVTGDHNWLWNMLALFNNPKVGAVGPTSNYVMGAQQIFYDSPFQVLNVKYLIGFCMLVRREALEKAGGIDDSLPGGDDIDLSIRLRDAGYGLLCARSVFMFHHGSVTGNKVNPGYWNSQAMQHKTNMALIKKHGMYKFWETLVNGWQDTDRYDIWAYASEDIEGNLCRKHVQGDAVLELGCGGRKTVPNAIGVDFIPSGHNVPFVTQGLDSSVSDIQADASRSVPIPSDSQDTVIARHLLEHCQDPMGTLMEWNRLLKMSGKLIIAVPNPELKNTIIMNPEHIISFSPTSLRNMVLCAGFEERALYEDVNAISFVGIYEKVGVPYFKIREANKTVFPLVARMEETTCV